ncbi:MAG: alpha/beta fold hydrolase [Proteobacteria bacterium]|nr:alpha/beta fold hydrolase [Pseudomonadota bacterium]
MGGMVESWDAVAPMLAAKRCVLRYDARGAGLSEKIRGSITIDDFTDDLFGLLRILGVTEPVALAGCAVGAGVAIHFAARFPDRVAGLVAMAPATGIAPERRAATMALADRIEREGLRPRVDEGISRTYPVQLRKDMRRFNDFRCRQIGNDPTSYAAMYRMLANLEMEADFARIECPTLVLAGLLDQTRPPATVLQVARSIPGARFEVIETGHSMANLTPELVAARIAGFLAEIGF